ncbi:N-acetyltransferase family protein [Variovorax sp. GT1P44]|uniref:GNAT family N-acetyltransferase n=1 Tax=Variovorax sp. GT1P44 TaxID=3443742 RepID=UPI003F48D4E4
MPRAGYTRSRSFQHQGFRMRRLAGPQDIEGVFSIYSHEKVVPFLTYEPMSLAEFGSIYEELLDSGCFYVWDVDGSLAGFYQATRYPGRLRHVALLGTVAVDPLRHGQGVGHAMLADAIERLKADGVRRIELYAESDNTSALRFYEKLGFVHEGTLREFYKRADEPHYVDEYVLGLLVG